MLATDVLVAHHDLLRALMAELAGIPIQRPQERRRLLDVLMAELSMHEMIEDEIFYPAMTAVSAIVPVAHAEHRQLSDQLAVVLRTRPDSDRFAGEFAALRTAVVHHADKEERVMFPEVRAKVGQPELERLGEALAARLGRLRGSRLTQLRLAAKRGIIRRTPAGRPRTAV